MQGGDPCGILSAGREALAPGNPGDCQQGMPASPSHAAPLNLLYTVEPGFEQSENIPVLNARDARCDIIDHISNTKRCLMSLLQEQLYQVAWEHLSHAYGPASDTPLHLLALLSNQVEEREYALEMLWSSICHQGSVYEASVAAVPFLIQILQQVPDEQKSSILGLLGGLAGQYRYAHRDQVVLKMDHSGQESCHQWQSWQQFLQEGNQFHQPELMQQAHQLVGEGLSVYLPHLRSTDQDTVRETLDLLACFQELNNAIIPPVIELFAETADAAVKASALYCLSTLLDAQSPYWEHFYRSVNANPAEIHPVVRLAAARSLAKHHRDNTPSVVADILVERMLEPLILHHAQDQDSEAPREERRRYSYDTDCRPLSDLGVPLGLEALIKALEQGATRWSLLDTMRVAEALLDVAFFGCWVENRYWSYRTTNYPFQDIDGLKDGVSSRNPVDPYFGKDIPDLDVEHAHFQFRYSETYTSLSELLIEVIGYDSREAARLKHCYERDGQGAVSDLEKHALQTVLRCEPLWQYKHNLLAIYGLPISYEEVELLLLKQ